MTRFCYSLQKSPRATFCHKKWRGLKLLQSSLSSVPDCLTGLRLFVSKINMLEVCNQWFENFKTEFRSLKWLCPHDFNFISRCRQSSLQNCYFFCVFHVSGGKQYDVQMCVCVWTTCFSSVPLSSRQRPLFVIGRGEKESARWTTGRGKRYPPSHRPLCPCFLSLIAIFIGIPSGASAEKRGFVSLPFTLYQTGFFGTKSNYYW